MMELTLYVNNVIIRVLIVRALVYWNVPTALLIDIYLNPINVYATKVILMTAAIYCVHLAIILAKVVKILQPVLVV